MSFIPNNGIPPVRYNPNHHHQQQQKYNNNNKNMNPQIPPCPTTPPLLPDVDTPPPQTILPELPDPPQLTPPTIPLFPHEPVVDFPHIPHTLSPKPDQLSMPRVIQHDENIMRSNVDDDDDVNIMLSSNQGCIRRRGMMPKSKSR